MRVCASGEVSVYTPELRALMENARTIATAEDMKYVNLPPSEQVWSRQLLYYMLGHERRSAEKVAERAKGRRC